MKVGIIGAGAVGSACLMSLVTRGSAREIVVVNRTRKRAKAVVTDLQYGAVLSPFTVLRDGEYEDLAGCAAVLITAGTNEMSGGATDRSDSAGRLRLLDTNATLYRDIVPRVHRAAPDAVIVVVTDPPDPLADVVRALGHERVISTGTYLDSLRFAVHLARKLHVSAAQVEAQVLGEHGTSQVFVWSSARVAGVPLRELLPEDADRQALEREVRYANITIIEGSKASKLGIGVVSARIAEMIGRDERAAIPIGSWNPDYRVTLSVPSILGRAGVLRRLPLALSPEEREALRQSAEKLREAAPHA